jgi:hypothetical protein
VAKGRPAEASLGLAPRHAPLGYLRSYIFEPRLPPAGNADERDWSAESLRQDLKRIVSAFRALVIAEVHIHPRLEERAPAEADALEVNWPNAEEKWPSW